jgi:hypothetical protein
VKTSVDLTKLVVALAAIAAVTVMSIAGTISADAGLPLITAIVGYVLGNGRSVSQGNVPGAILAPTPPDTEVLP